MAATPDRPRIFSHLTRTRFLHIEDDLARRKLRFFLGSFERGYGANSTTYAFLDVDDSRVVMSDLSWGKILDFVDYKGGLDSSGDVISRVLKIKRTRSDEDKVWVEVQNGAGEELAEGAIKPSGKPFADISIPLTIFQGRKMAYAVLAYLHAWDVGTWLKNNPGR